jgi:hypothetical protein
VAGPIVAVVLAVGGLGVARPDPASVRFTDGTPDDLRAVAEAAWERFADAVPACADRLGTVTVAVAWDLADRARYEPGPALVRIRAPGTAANLEASLLHEYAHHAERRCPPDAAERDRFLAAAGLSARTPWRGGEPWNRIPSERFAEAVVAHVLGGPPPHVLIHLRPAEVHVAAAWAGG